MFEFHKSRKKFYDLQYKTAKEYIIPYLQKTMEISEGTKVCEIGCGEAGVLAAFRELGCDCTGVELQPTREEWAREYHATLDLPGSIELINKNIYDVDPNDPDFKYDIIILKDVIEHIHDQSRFMLVLLSFLRKGGQVFFGFPPWRMPYGGHQQICRSKLSKLPYLHLLPSGIYRKLLESAGEKPKHVRELIEIKETGIGINRFESIAKQSGFVVLRRKLWFLNPIYKYKFGRGPIAQSSVVGGIPYFRDFFTTAVYYTLTAA